MKEATPPAWAHGLLQKICPSYLWEGIEGDLLEQFELDVELVGEARARRRFIWNALRFIRPGIILRNKGSYNVINAIMVANYFKVAARNIQKRKFYSFINAFGLSIGLAFCMLIALYIQDEREFDQMHANKNQIYRIEEKSFDTWMNESPDPYRRSAWLQAALGPTLKEELPEVEYATRFNDGNRAIFRYGDKVFTERLTYVDKDFFSMFSFQLRKGNAERIFLDKSEVVLTPEIATKYFGDEDPIGKSIEIDNNGKQSFTVTGIIEPPPSQSSLRFAILLPQENRNHYEYNMENWGNFGTPTFVQLRSDANMEGFKANLDKVIEKYMSKRLEDWRKEAVVPIPADVKMLEYEFTMLPDIHLKKEISWDKVSDSQYSFILGGIALLIMLIACINYVSLALTTSASRRVEVGVRKVVGAQRSQLIYQFSLESLILAIISLVIGFGLVLLFLPSFNEFTNKGIELTLPKALQLLSVGLALTLITGLIAGSYPSLFLSRFRPALVLKGGFTSRLQAGFTKPLVVLQFALSAFLIICSIMMYRQMRFITTKDLGYNKDQVLIIPTQAGWNEETDRVIEQFRTRSQQEPLIVSVAGTSSSFNQGYSRYGFKINGEQKSAYVYAADPDYIPTLGIQLTEGRNFDVKIPADSDVVIVNEALVRDMKWTDPLNEHYNWREDSVGMGSRVIGVVKNYHFLSLEQNFEPMFLSMDKHNVGYLTTMMVKVSANDVTAGLARVREIWKELYPDKPFDYTFLDEDVAKQYSSYKRWMNIMALATGFGILISCLGLFGLAGINAVNRTKEIGIRKVMGANLQNIFILLNRQFIILAVVAFALAAPLSWWFITTWYMKDFSFKVALSWDLFVLSMGTGLLLALLTVSYHAIKVALVNPAETLKYE
ncbi:MAG TPA: ABC transporter permease [Cyclobacteriaceae bacterium]|nr:ABC transporter permease [Cytophagales bacterium]HRE66389.1 ABC transporter permease [Cyclobacteriaceae bacterium]HRF32789.1 ABC transporter permease [Cyclobacteriaceae bacterium]